MKYLPHILLTFSFFVVFYLLFFPEHKTALGEGVYEEVKPIVLSKNGFRTIEPKWKRLSRVREISDPSFGVVLGDIESHLPNGHHYGDSNKITWAHESSHGINARLRNDVATMEGYNGFYVLQDRSIILKEPEISIRDIAAVIPEVLRGPSFDLYLIEQATIWNDRPLYLVDEWVAYTNGSEAGRELNIRGLYYELLQAYNFNVYCMYLAMVVQRDCSDYRDAELKQFIMWNTERVFKLTIDSDRKIEDSGLGKAKTIKASSFHICPHQLLPDGYSNSLDMVVQYIEKVKAVPEAEKLRRFAKKYFGEEWCRQLYGF
jgi:hypothetical protein